MMVYVVQWTKEGYFISIGTNLDQVQIWDGTKCKKIRTMEGHQTRTGVLAWNSRILASGSRDRNILQHDMRVSSEQIKSNKVLLDAPCSGLCVLLKDMKELINKVKKSLVAPFIGKQVHPGGAKFSICPCRHHVWTIWYSILEFFLATLIGKVVVKAHIQTIFIISVLHPYCLN
ncbi:hypothetical protein P8452_57445 [Trifolium repens]|nr:hypothetical protein P8452_57445 [Trifolium repens]